MVGGQVNELLSGGGEEAGEAELLDVREADEWVEGHIADAYCIPLRDVPVRFGELDADKKWVCICHVGQRSVAATAFLEQQGLRSANMLGGMDAWERARLPTEAGRGEPSP